MLERNEIVEVKGNIEAFVVERIEGNKVILRCLEDGFEANELIKPITKMNCGVECETGLYRCDVKDVYRIEMDTVDDVIEVLAQVPYLKDCISMIEEKLDNLRWENENLSDELECLYDRLI